MANYSPDPVPEFTGDLTEIHRRIEAASIDYTVMYWYPDDADRAHPGIMAFLGEGWSRHALAINDSLASKLCALPFEMTVPLAPYEAFYFPDTQTVEGLISHRGSYRANFFGDAILSLPGVVRDEGEEWRLEIPNCPYGVKMVISPPSERFDTILNRPLNVNCESVSVKLSAIQHHQEESLQALLEMLISNVSFEIYRRYGVHLMLSHKENPGVGGQSFTEPESMVPISFPSSAYSPSAVTLHSFGILTENYPLMRYLAYYQSIEYFYPTFFRFDYANRLGAVLRRNAIAVDRELEMELANAVLAGRRKIRSNSERDDIKQVLSFCLTNDDISRFLDGLHYSQRDHLASNDGLRAVSTLNSAMSDTLVSQVANRIYDIRCRIVHTKNHPDSEIEPLLPFSWETNNLRTDLQLIDMVSQKVIRGSAMHGLS